MKKSSVFMAAGTILLAATAVFATKANKKFAHIGTAKFSFNSITYHVHAPIESTDGLFTTSGSRGQLELSIYTASASKLVDGSLVTKTNGSVDVLYNAGY
jgi:hypothetical protein